MAFHRGFATDYQDLADRLKDIISNGFLDSAVVAVGGTNYAVGDLLAVLGGTFIEKAVVEVTGEAAGVVTSVRVYNAGTYTVNPGSPASTRTLSDSAGSGCTLTLTMDTAKWVIERDTTFSTGEEVDERELIFNGEGDGTEAIFCGIRTYNANNGFARGWEMAGFTGFNGGNTWENQPGISPGRFETDSDGAFSRFSLGKMAYWISVTSRRIIGVARVAGRYSTFFLGFINPFGTPLEYPYPLYVGGDTNDPDDNLPWGRNLSRTNGSIAIPIGTVSTVDTGPAWLRKPDGVWIAIKSLFQSATTSMSQHEESIMFPMGIHDSNGNTKDISTEDQIIAYSSSIAFFLDQLIIAAYNQEIFPTAHIRKTPDGVNGLLPLFPMTIMNKRSGTDQSLFGELPNVFYPAGADFGNGYAPEDRYIDENNIPHTLFNTGPNAAGHFMWALRED